MSPIICLPVCLSGARLSRCFSFLVSLYYLSMCLVLSGSPDALLYLIPFTCFLLSPTLAHTPKQKTVKLGPGFDLSKQGSGIATFLSSDMYAHSCFPLCLPLCLSLCLPCLPLFPPCLPLCVSHCVSPTVCLPLCVSHCVSPTVSLVPTTVSPSLSPTLSPTVSPIFWLFQQGPGHWNLVT